MERDPRDRRKLRWYLAGAGNTGSEYVFRSKQERERFASHLNGLNLRMGSIISILAANRSRVDRRSSLKQRDDDDNDDNDDYGTWKNKMNDMQEQMNAVAHDGDILERNDELQEEEPVKRRGKGKGKLNGKDVEEIEKVKTKFNINKSIRNKRNLSIGLLEMDLSVIKAIDTTVESEGSDGDISGELNKKTVITRNSSGTNTTSSSNNNLDDNNSSVQSLSPPIQREKKKRKSIGKTYLGIKQSRTLSIDVVQSEFVSKMFNSEWASMPAKIYIGSWNAGGAPPSKNQVHSWIRSQYVI